MADKEAEVLPAGVAKGLADKFYEKRKNAALEIEKCVRSFQPLLLLQLHNHRPSHTSPTNTHARIVKNIVTSEGDKHRILVLIATLRKDYIFSSNPNNRKGGLLGLAATAIALGQVCAMLSHCDPIRELSLVAPPFDQGLCLRACAADHQVLPRH